MTGAPADVYLHIGLHKTGTTYLQNVMRANRAGMRAQGVEFTGGPDEPVQAFAVWDLQGRRPRGTRDARIAGQWNELVEAVNGSGRPTALVSEERLSLCTLKQVRRAVEAFPDSTVHVVVTARDLGRVAVSAWQEEVKNDQTWTWQEFVAAIKDPEQVATNPARVFWMRQDLLRICETWEAVVPAERIHVLTVPPSGTSPAELLGRFASVVGFNARKLTEEPVWSNETVGVAGTEVIRRVNARLEGRLNQRQYDRVIKMTVVKLLADRTDPARFTLPGAEVGWVSERAEQLIDALRERGYPVEGDLDELRPRVRDGGRCPDDATDDELLEAALDALAMLSEKYATTWWRRRKLGPRESEGGSGDLGSKARAAVFRSQRKAAEVADRQPAAAKALGMVLKARDRATARARARNR
ncbi:MAG: hypothetical protein ACRDQA_29130 [Nocardioidaceae bacterium]